jgi:capsular exopolysaccharide synthesis family protein
MPSTPPEVPTMDVRDYVRVIRRRLPTIIFTAMLVVGAALALSFSQTPVYEATAKVLVAPRLAEQIAGSEAGTEAPRAIETEIEVLNSRGTRQAARSRLGHVPNISVSGVGTTQVVRIEARSTDRERAASDANGYADTYIELRREAFNDELLAASEEIQGRVDELDNQRALLEAELAGLPIEDEGARRRADERLSSVEPKRDGYLDQLDNLEVAANLAAQGGSAQVISEAGVPVSPVSPKPIRNGVAALGLGLVLGVGLAFAREYLDDTVRNEDDLVRSSGLTVVGRIPRVEGWKNRKAPFLVSVTNPNSAAAEAYRTLRTNVQFLDLEHPIRSLQVTSANAQEGKTTTLANLAVTMAKTGQRVIVVCCDLRRPRLHEFFGLSHEVGFTSVLLGESPLSQALQPAGAEGRLLMLASGPPPPNPSELLASKRAAELFDLLAGRADLLLVDSPPVLPVTDALVISGLVDATLVVGTAGNTAKRGLHSAVGALRQVDAPLVGSVLNGIAAAEAEKYGYGGYTYGYSEDEARAARPGRATANGGKRARKPTGATRRS